MNKIDAVVTRVLDVRPYRDFWIVEVRCRAGADTARRQLSAIPKKKPGKCEPATP